MKRTSVICGPAKKPQSTWQFAVMAIKRATVANKIFMVSFLLNKVCTGFQKGFCLKNLRRLDLKGRKNRN
jgi:hypothetical protein